ncbi:MAG: hypothetical protein J6M05_01470 [Cardiobacteriaceae bacterium]|nr:hypothetical protein [Cardiobacteriaceae bacterium]
MPLFVFICKTNPQFFTADLFSPSISVSSVILSEAKNLAVNHRHFEHQAKNLTVTVILSRRRKISAVIFS